MNTLYEVDFSAWLNAQICLLRSKQFDQVDLEHLLGEMEDLGNSYKEAIESHLTIILIHMLKQSPSDSINDGRVQIEKKIQRHPSLKNYPKKVFHESYEDARRHASRQTGIDLRKFPKECPWPLEEVLDCQ